MLVIIKEANVITRLAEPNEAYQDILTKINTDNSFVKELNSLEHDAVIYSNKARDCNDAYYGDNNINDIIKDINTHCTIKPNIDQLKKLKTCISSKQTFGLLLFDITGNNYNYTCVEISYKSRWFKSPLIVVNVLNRSGVHF